VSAEAERLFVRLITVADDTGRFDADPLVLKATCFTLLVDQIETQSVEKWREELVTSGVIQIYQVDGRIYGHFPNWSRYQRQYGTKPKFPEPPAKFGEPPRSAADSRSYPRSESRDPRVENENRESKGDGDFEEKRVGSLGNETLEGKSEREKLLKANAELLRRRARLRGGC